MALSSSTDDVSGTLITRNYTDFRGVDFSNKEVSLYRSPNSLNMWKNYKNSLGKMIETRPDAELLESFDNTVFGLFFYEISDVTQLIVHSGTKLYKIYDGERTELYTGMNPAKSSFFVYNNILYIKDAINYLQYDGTEVTEVVGYIPTTTIACKPEGGGTTYEDVNMLSAWRKCTFVGDGESTEYYLDSQNIDDVSPIITIETETIETLSEGNGYTWDSEAGLVTFDEAPAEPLTTGQANVTIQYRKTVEGYADRINRCSILTVFDNRVFFSGNPNFPNTMWHSSLDDPTYVSDLDYYNEGLDLAPIKSMIAGNNALWVMKEPSQANTTIFYHNPTIDSDYGKTYPSTHSSISIGCHATGINFNDDICFFSDRGMEAISSDVTTEQVIAHRSSLVDSKLLNEENYNDMILEEWAGYLLIIIDNKVYLADSRAMFTNEDHSEYEFFYWELDITPTITCVKDGILYLGTADGIYTLTNEDSDREVNSYWLTPLDEFKYPHYQKTTNKRGCVVDMEGESVTVSVKIDNDDFVKINDYTNTKGYVVCRIKKKKWKAIQMKFESTKPFGLYSNTLEAYVGAYIKR